MKQFAQAAVGSIGQNGPSTPGFRTDMPQMPRQQPQQQRPQSRPDMDGPAGLDDIINQMNLQPNIPDLDNISLMMFIKIEEVIVVGLL